MKELAFLAAVLVVMGWIVSAIVKAWREPSPERDAAASTAVVILSGFLGLGAALLYVGGKVEAWIYALAAVLAGPAAAFFSWRQGGRWRAPRAFVSACVAVLPPFFMLVSTPGLRSALDKSRQRRQLELTVPELSAVRDGKAPPSGVVPRLAAVVRGGPEEIRAAALRTLGGYGAEAAPALEAVVGALGGSAAVRDAALDALAQLGPAGQAALVEALEKAELRAGAWEALQRPLKLDGALVPRLSAMLKSPEVDVRAKAAAALARAEPAAAAAGPALIAALSDADAAVRREAARALGRLGGPGQDVVAALAEALGDPQEWVRAYAMESLAIIGPPARPAAPAVLKILDDPSDFARTHAFRFLGRLSPPADGAVEALVAALDGDRRRRNQAISALGQLGPAAAPAAARLAAVLDSGEKESRVYALYALGAIGPAAAAASASIERWKDDPDKVTRWRARQALELVAGRPAGHIRLER